MLQRPSDRFRFESGALRPTAVYNGKQCSTARGREPASADEARHQAGFVVVWPVVLGAEVESNDSKAEALRWSFFLLVVGLSLIAVEAGTLAIKEPLG